MVEAGLRIWSRVRSGRCEGVRVERSRPSVAEELVGLQVDEALSRLSKTSQFSARAHDVAARAAIGAARAEPFVLSIEVERAISAESAQEHLSRLLLDWPGRFGRQAQRNRLEQLHHRLSQASSAASAFEVGGTLLDFVARDLLSGFFLSLREPASLSEFISATRYGGFVGETLAELIEAGRWVPEGGQVAPFLPPYSAAEWAQLLGNTLPAVDFAHAPVLNEETGSAVFETGALARQSESPLVAALLGYGHRIAARVFAQVVDLSDDASRLRHPLASDMQPCADAAGLDKDAGLACVQTSRGVLLHLVRLDGDVVADYRIVEPTDWNFAPGGAFEREASGWQAESDEAAFARLDWLALSLSPSHPCEVLEEPTAHA